MPQLPGQNIPLLELVVVLELMTMLLEANLEGGLFAACGLEQLPPLLEGGQLIPQCFDRW